MTVTADQKDATEHIKHLAAYKQAKMKSQVLVADIYI